MCIMLLCMLCLWLLRYRPAPNQHSVSTTDIMKTKLSSKGSRSSRKKGMVFTVVICRMIRKLLVMCQRIAARLVAV